MIHFLWSDPRSEKGKREEEDRERDKGKRKKSVVKSSKQNSPALRGCITAVTDRVRALKRHFFVKQKCAPQFIHGTDITVFPHFLLFCFLFLLFFTPIADYSPDPRLWKLRRQGFMYWKNEVLSPLSEGNKILSEGIPTKQVLTRSVWAFKKRFKMTLLAASHMCSADAILGSSFTVGYFQHASFFSH